MKGRRQEKIKMGKEKVYKYPRPDQLQISSSDLKLKFREFLEAVGERFSFFDLLVIAPAWIPLFTSDFRDVSGYPGSGAQISGVYLAIVFFGTVIWLTRIRNFVVRPILRFLVWCGWVSDQRLGKLIRATESNPDRKVDCIKSECQ